MPVNYQLTQQIKLYVVKQSQTAKKSKFLLDEIHSLKGLICNLQETNQQLVLSNNQVLSGINYKKKRLKQHNWIFKWKPRVNIIIIYYSYLTLSTHSNNRQRLFQPIVWYKRKPWRSPKTNQQMLQCFNRFVRFIWMVVSN